jgi:hypothetical protein
MDKAERRHAERAMKGWQRAMTDWQLLMKALLSKDEIFALDSLPFIAHRPDLCGRKCVGESVSQMRGLRA